MREAGRDDRFSAAAGAQGGDGLAASGAAGFCLWRGARLL
jgi:hypothetical protein